MMMIDDNGEENDVDEEVMAGRRRTVPIEGHIVLEREHMFNKVVTPSDVGKLNRLVIPKQHAEKYFPLDSSTNEKGLLLNFEDRTGKQWRFRYSYWNSSQSYVMTKGWSRFVKEKKLDAGDVVSFHRGVGEFGRDRLFIDWRRRPDAPASSSSSQYHHHHLLGSGLAASPSNLSFPHQYYSTLQRTSPAAWDPSLFYQQQHHRPLSSSAAAQYYPAHPQTYMDHYSSDFLLPPPHSPGGITATHHHPHSHHVHPPLSYMRNQHPVNVNPSGPRSGSVIYYQTPASQQQQQQQVEDARIAQIQRTGWGGFEPSVVYESVPVVQGTAAPKRLRLFGVNMECPTNTSASSNSDDIVVENVHNDNMTLSSSSSTKSATAITPSLISHSYYPRYNLSSSLPLPPPPLLDNTHTASSSNIPYLQLSPQTNTTPTTAAFSDLFKKDKSSMSFDLDI